MTASPNATGGPPYELAPNQYSLLDKTDLVFIDAVGTGFSRPVGKATDKNFAGTDQDVQAFAKFITRYVTVNQRWNSPKFLFGESYGTTRSAALVDVLENDGMSFNGVVLMSTILNYFVRSPGGRDCRQAERVYRFEHAVFEGSESAGESAALQERVNARRPRDSRAV
jgi:carboxypeptidase C (cathepsin A)